MGNPTIFNGRRTRLLTVDGLVNSNNSKNDFDGQINYILNGHYEQVITGTNAYADAAGALPVDGTGGTPTITIARSTVTPLRGQAHLLFTKPASNVQGNGFSIDFTIDAIDTGKLLSIGADVELLSGTYDEGTQTTPSDLTCYVYDITNAVLLPQPAEYRVIPNAIGLGGRLQTSFQTNTNSVSYRLIFHCATTSTAAYTLAVDNISVGPSEITRGALVTNETSYTPTFTGFGTVSVQNFRQYRVGEYLYVNGEFTFGTTTATEARISLPAGLTVASSLPTLSLVGDAGRNQFAGTYFRNSILAEPNVSYITIGTQTNGTSGVVKALGSQLGSSGDVFYLNFKVKIQGWSSSQQLSSDAGLRSVVFRASTSTARTINNTSPTIIYETITKDTVGGYNTSTGEYTVRESGDYKFGASYRTISHTSTVSNVRAMLLFRNGTQVSNFAAFRSQITGSIVYQSNGSDTQFFNAGDVLTWRMYSDDATTLAASTPLDNYIYLEKLSSPQQLAASEIAHLSVGKTTSQSIANTTGTVIQSWDTPSLDNMNAFNPTTGVYTVPRGGIANVQLQIAFAANATGARLLVIQLNGATDVSAIEYQGSGTATVTGTAHWKGAVKAGDTIRFLVSQNSGGALNITNLNAYNRATIEIK